MAIAYDQPVTDLIAGLNATGHVTHTSYPKTSVTLHHNAVVGLSHLDILRTWTSRPSSAHFDVDGSGALAQYVKETEYAWAVGNTDGNEHTISIEMANSTVAPGWQVGDVTWRAAARLAGWLFAHVIEGRPRPTASNLFPHRHWSATACPGPYVLGIFGDILAAAQTAYDSFTAPPRQPAQIPEPVQEDEDMKPIIFDAAGGQWVLFASSVYLHIPSPAVSQAFTKAGAVAAGPIDATFHAQLVAGSNALTAKP